ncbi:MULTISPECIES: arsenate reductase ArsC [Comamonas]|uniref:ArsC family transcriptional regulator n=2 Tax=Comamonas TaxID=283 RepID=A0A096F425_COMTE|nr:MULTISPECIES: arsenate reductase ArsC [Comamonas]KGG98686.1 ArsC family transcriptional regulator [Comamonas thiooxydans]KGH27068.1 ArsC family transcriptional regulator [Comamonas testosteroni]
MTTHILILCTHNSARSVLAEGMLNHLATVRGLDVRAHSAGSAPSGRINPLALEALASAGVRTDAFRSKSWDEFTAADAPVMRIVITVCDSAASEVCPYWPGTPIQMHTVGQGRVEEHLLGSTPPKITVQRSKRAGGAPLRVYRLAAE